MVRTVILFILAGAIQNVCLAQQKTKLFMEHSLPHSFLDEENKYLTDFLNSLHIRNPMYSYEELTRVDTLLETKDNSFFNIHYAGFEAYCIKVILQEHTKSRVTIEKDIHKNLLVYESYITDTKGVSFNLSKIIKHYLRHYKTENITYLIQEQISSIKDIKQEKNIIFPEFDYKYIINEEFESDDIIVELPIGVPSDFILNINFYKEYLASKVGKKDYITDLNVLHSYLESQDKDSLTNEYVFWSIIAYAADTISKATNTKILLAKENEIKSKAIYYPILLDENQQMYSFYFELEEIINMKSFSKLSNTVQRIIHNINKKK